jgi:non-ribosomal peptide synthetase component F
MAAAQAYWSKTLRGAAMPTPLMHGLAGALAPTGAPARGGFVKETLALSTATTAALEALGRRHGLTLGAMVYGAWALLVGHYSGAQDIVFGSLSSGRPPAVPRVEYMVGFFNNILPLRLQIDEGATLVTWLAEVQGRMLEMRDYEYTPLLALKDWLCLPAGTLPFESYVVFENFPEYSYDRLQVSTSARQRGQAPHPTAPRQTFVPTEYPLRIEVWPLRSLALKISCYKHYADDAAVRQLLTHLARVLETMVQEPRQRLGELMARSRLGELRRDTLIRPEDAHAGA